MRITKAHAYGNDFLYARRAEVHVDDIGDLARRLCDRHRGLGADGLIVFDETPTGARMDLRNADGSPSEVSGNGVRGLAAILARERGLTRQRLVIETAAGAKVLDLLDSIDARAFRFVADMGRVSGVRHLDLEVPGVGPRAALGLEVGNPQCVFLVDRLDAVTLDRLGPTLQAHAAFPEGVNVEFALVESRSRVRILIWERGCGPTLSSGTGSCAAAFSAMHAGAVDETVEVVAPGGVQHVERRGDRLLLTGWAHVVAMADWIG